MEKENLPPFYIGQLVIGHGAPETSAIKNGQEYTIRTVHYSPSGNPIAKGASFWYVGITDWPEHDWLSPKLFIPKYPPLIMTFKQLTEIEIKELLINN